MFHNYNHISRTYLFMHCRNTHSCIKQNNQFHLNKGKMSYQNSLCMMYQKYTNMFYIFYHKEHTKNKTRKFQQDKLCNKCYCTIYSYYFKLEALNYNCHMVIQLLKIYIICTRLADFIHMSNMDNCKKSSKSNC